LRDFGINVIGVVSEGCQRGIRGKLEGVFLAVIVFLSCNVSSKKAKLT